MRKSFRVVMLVASIMLFSMQSVVEAKYVLSYTNKIADVCVDKINPIIEGVQENGKYNQEVTVKYYDNTEIKSAVYYYNSESTDFNVEPKSFDSGHVFTDDGYYKIIITDMYNNELQIKKFLIDKTPPQITGVEKGKIYDLPPNVEYYDKYGIEKIEIKQEEDLKLEYQYWNSNRKIFSDRNSTQISVDISYSPKNVKEYKWYVKKESEIEYKLIDTNLDNKFTFTNLEPGTIYNIYCLANTVDNRAYMSNLIVAQTMQDIENVEIIDISDVGYQIKVTGISDKYRYIYFPSWTDANAQDDLIWYQHRANNECTFDLNYEKHNKESGLYITHIYLQEEGKEVVKVQEVNIWLNQEEPEKEIIEPTGGVEITVTDKVGNVSNTDYFVDEIVTIKMNKFSYTKMKEILKDDIETLDDENYVITIKKSNLAKIEKLEITDYINENDEYFEGINYFRELEYLDISSSSKARTDELSTLTNLKYLDISNCSSEYVYDLSFLSKLPNLEYLNTTGTNIINEEVIQSLPNLIEWKN